MVLWCHITASILRSNILPRPPTNSPKNLKDYFDGVWGVPTKKEKPRGKPVTATLGKPLNSVSTLVHRLLSVEGGSSVFRSLHIYSVV